MGRAAQTHRSEELWCALRMAYGVWRMAYGAGLRRSAVQCVWRMAHGVWRMVFVEGLSLVPCPWVCGGGAHVKGSLNLADIMTKAQAVAVYLQLMALFAELHRPSP